MISVKNVHFSYNRETHAVRGVSFDIPDGEWVSIIGHNGSGKSTLSKLINGLIRPNKGEIYIDDELLNDDTINNIRKKVGIVFQNPDNQFIGVTVKHDIAFGLENRQIERSKMLEIIDEYAKKVDMDNEDYTFDIQKIIELSQPTEKKSSINNTKNGSLF